MKETLQPFHFQKPERPKEEDYNPGYHPSIDAQYYGAAMDEFQKALSEWESLYGDKPEPEWISFEEKKPEEGQCIYEAQRTRGKLRMLIGSGMYWKEMYKKNYNLKSMYWADKDTYDTRLAEWKYRQVRYPGFKEQENLLYKGDPGSRVFIRFDGKATTICGPGFHCDFEKGLSFSLFDMIIKENGIEL